jgi:type I restriction enzyme S subunit
MQLVPGFAFKSEDFSSDPVDRLPLIRIRDLISQEPVVFVPRAIEARYLVRRGDFLVGMDGEFQAVRWAAADGALNQRVLKFSSSSVDLDSEFLFYRLQPELERLEQVISATTVKHLSTKHLNGLEIPLPPVSEQRRIAEVLSSVDEAIQATQAVIEQTRKVKEGVLQRLLTKGIGHTRFKHTEVGELPEGWEVCRIDQLGEVRSGRQRSPNFAEGDARPYLRVANVFDGFIDTDDLLEMKFTDKEFCNFKLEPHDILLNEGQSLELVGRNAVYDGRPSDCCFQNTLIRFRSYPKTNPRFSYTLMQYLYISGRFSQIATQTTSVAHLGGKRFAALVVGVPPRAEQDRIAEIHDALISKDRHQKDCLLSLITTKSALMSDLLTGRTRVSASLPLAAE